MLGISIVVAVIYSAVNLMLLVCSCGLLKRRFILWRCLLGSLVAGIYAAVCLFTSNASINNWWVYLILLTFVSVVAFGFMKRWLVVAAVYIMLSLSLGGADIGAKGAISLLIGSVGIWLVLLISRLFPEKNLVKVQIDYLDKCIKFNALIDSGNLLKDSLTGNSVLIVDADVANRLLGLSTAQLRQPIDSMDNLKGFRLLPYNTISERGNFLLAKKINDVKIGDWKGSVLVAFCPEVLSSNGRYQGLIGGQ